MNNVVSNVKDVEDFLHKNSEKLSAIQVHPLVQWFFEVGKNKDYLLLMVILIDSYKSLMRTKKI